jgi:hypothetical protein
MGNQLLSALLVEFILIYFTAPGVSHLLIFQVILL